MTPGPDMDLAGRRQGSYLLLCGVMTAVLAALLFYSQTAAFAWDEGFHLLAAQLIKAGRKPYLDFCFPQTPLNAYWNAAWMRMFGESWRPVHALAAVLTAGAAMLAADFVYTRLPAPRWRLACALVAGLAVCGNSIVVEFATVGQAYGMCLFLAVAAFRVAVVAARRGGWALASAAGLLAGAAAGSSLLTAAMAPVLLIWLLLCNRAGNRWIKGAAFVAGAAVPFLPVLWLYIQAPRTVWFNLLQYQTAYRRANWDGATEHDLEVLTSWVDSGQALCLGLLALGGLLFLREARHWDRPRRAEFYLCGWLAAALCVESGVAHPTFERYFLLAVPFIAILAAVGLHAAGVRLYAADRPWLPAVVLTLLLALSLGRALWDDRNSYHWRDLEKVAKKIDEVTRPGGTLWADEPFYFLTRRTPPDGMEFSYSHGVELPAPRAATLHILPQSELNRRIAAGAFETSVTCDDDEIQKHGLPDLYAQKAEVASCTVFWDLK